MKSHLIAAFIFASGFSAFAQEPSGFQQSTKAEAAPQIAEPTSSDAKYDTSDPYLGRGEAIASVMISGEIPEDFPRYEEGMAFEDYKQLISVWFKNNQDLIKAEDLERLRSRF